MPPGPGDLRGGPRGGCGYVACYAPPLVSVPDCRVLGKWVDGFLIVVTAHRTARKLLEEALHVTEPAKIVGLVFNGDDRHVSRGYSYVSRRPSDRNGGRWQRRFFGSRTRRRQNASDD